MKTNEKTINKVTQSKSILLKGTQEKNSPSNDFVQHCNDVNKLYAPNIVNRTMDNKKNKFIVDWQMYE